MNKFRLYLTILAAAASLTPAFIAFYLTRGQGHYLFLLSLLLAALGLCLITGCILERTSAKSPPDNRGMYLIWRSPLMLISVVLAISAVLLEGRVLSWLLGNKDAIEGLPWTASLLLLFVSTFMFAWESGHSTWSPIFNVRLVSVILLAALVVIIFTFINAFGTASMETYTSVMKGVFFMVLGACLAVLISSRRGTR